MKEKNVVIIGNGVAGVTAARFVRKLDTSAKIVMISPETEHFYSRPALMYIYMGHQTFEQTKPYEDHFWTKNRIDLIRDFVTDIDIEMRTVSLRDSNETLKYDDLVLATGSNSNWFGWKGQDATGVQALYNYQDLESMEENTRNINRAVILGGGLIGVEMAEMLSSRNIPVTYLIRERGFSSHFLSHEEAIMVSGHVRAHGVDLREETELDEILSDTNGRVRAVRTNKGEEITCEFVGITVGVRPNIKLAASSGIEVDRGILANDLMLTSVPHIYAVGDCVQMRVPKQGRRPIEPVWYTGKIQGKTAAHNIRGRTAPMNRAFGITRQNFSISSIRCTETLNPFSRNQKRPCIGSTISKISRYE